MVEPALSALDCRSFRLTFTSLIQQLRNSSPILWLVILMHCLINLCELFGLLFTPGSLEPVDSLYEKPPLEALGTCTDVVEVGFADLFPVLGFKFFNFFLFSLRVS